jgi:hypothetical protein
MIQLYANEAASQLRNKNVPVIAGLCCSHYGYCLSDFAAALRDEGIANVEIVNPNDGMSALLFAEGKNAYSGGKVRVEVVSRAEITNEERNSIGRILELTSPRTAAALRKYTLKKDLFSFKL